MNAALSTTIHGAAGAGQLKPILSDDEFHQTLVEACGSPRIISFLDRMRLQMLRARWLNVTMPQRQE